MVEYFAVICHAGIFFVCGRRSPFEGDESMDKSTLTMAQQIAEAADRLRRTAHRPQTQVGDRGSE